LMFQHEAIPIGAVIGFSFGLALAHDVLRVGSARLRLCDIEARQNQGQGQGE